MASILFADYITMQKSGEIGETEEIINEHGVSVTRIIVFTDQEVSDLRNATTQIIQMFHENRRKGEFNETDLEEVVMFGTIGCIGSYFTSIDVSDDFKVVNSNEFGKLFTSYNNFTPFNNIMSEAFVGPIIRLFESMCKHKKMSGRVIFRGHVKSFIGKKPMLSNKIKNELGWHYDYSALTTCAIEILNDLATTGILMFAKNGYKGECSGYWGDNQRQIKPIKKTIMSVNYSHNTALLFDHKRGTHIHCPAVIKVKTQKPKEIYVRTVIQVVLYDKEWMTNKN